MKRTIFLIMVFSLLLLFTAELQSAEKLSDRIMLIERAKLETMTPEEIAAEIAKSSKKSKDGGYVANHKAIDCFSSYSCKYTGGRYKDAEITFRLRVPPKMAPGKKYPLIVSLHGVGESNDDNRRQLSHLHYSLRFFIGPESLDCFVLVPRCPVDNKSWTNFMQVQDGKGDSPLEYTKEILDELMKIYPIDANRISCFGLCSGAAACWEMAGRWPDLFCAMATTQLTTSESDPTIYKLLDMPIWMFNNVDDRLFPIAPIRIVAKKFAAAGGSICLTEGRGGHDSWTRALRDHRVVAWLAAQEKGHISPPPGITLLPKRTWQEARCQIVLPGLLFLILWLIWESLQINRNKRKEDNVSEKEIKHE